MNIVAEQTIKVASSNVEAEVGLESYKIKLWFIATASFDLKIKNTMKISANTENKTSAPSLFTVAANLEDFTPAASSKPASSPNQTPFADLMLHSEKLEAALKTSATEVRKTSSSSAGRMIQKKRNGAGAGKPSGHSLVKTEFHLEAPTAGSVKLAADFTNWEKSPLDLIKLENGVWHAMIPLSPGEYAYRFIVDGQWRDDPSPVLRMPNPFGTSNAVIKVI